MGRPQPGYCAACAFNELSPARPNAPVLVTFVVLNCSATYQLKSKSGPSEDSPLSVELRLREVRWMPSTTVTAPHYAFLHYSADDWQVKSLFLVRPVILLSHPPSFRREARLQLKQNNAGWVGSNILLGSLSPEGRVNVVVSETRPATPARCATIGPALSSLQTPDAIGHGCIPAVLACVIAHGATSSRPRWNTQRTSTGFVQRLRPSFQQPLTIDAEHLFISSGNYAEGENVRTFLGEGKYFKSETPNPSLPFPPRPCYTPPNTPTYGGTPPWTTD